MAPLEIEASLRLTWRIPWLTLQALLTLPGYRVSRQRIGDTPSELWATGLEEDE